MCILICNHYNPLLKQADLAPGAVDRMRQYGESVIDSATIGDYDLFLVETRGMPYPQVGLQRVGRDMTSIEDQEDTTPHDRGPFSLSLMKNTLMRWKMHYDHLLLASMNEDKTQQYLRLLKLLKIPYTLFSVMGHTIAQI